MKRMTYVLYWWQVGGFPLAWRRGTRARLDAAIAPARPPMSAGRCTLPSMPTPSHLRVVFLGSGSAGNAVVVTDGTTTLLVDCGFSARETARRMTLAGLCADDVSAILVTHEHSDHIRGVEVFQRRHGMATVACTAGTQRAAGFVALSGDVLTLVPGEVSALRHAVGGAVSHLARCRRAGRLSHRERGRSAARARDRHRRADRRGRRGARRRRRARASRATTISACSRTGPYPHYLKRRIRSERGHLSNPDACDALERLASDRLKHVFALHRSHTNNSASIVKRGLAARASAIGLRVPIDVAPQDDVMDSEPPQGSLFADEEG